MVKKIISGGQTGADLAALDFAIQFNIPHGGYIPKGRRTEHGPLPLGYRLTETPDYGYLDRTRLNVLSADGTLVVSQGPISGGSELTCTFAHRAGKNLLHIDLKEVPAFQASRNLLDWIKRNHVEILNVAGPRASKDPDIYTAVIGLLETAYFMGISEKAISGFESSGSFSPLPPSSERYPETLETAVSVLYDLLSFSEKSRIARIPESRLDELHDALGNRILKRFNLAEENGRLIADCRKYSGNESLNIDGAVAMIIHHLWRFFQKQKNILKVVK
jgi:hypothetical protein